MMRAGRSVALGAALAAAATCLVGLPGGTHLASSAGAIGGSDRLPNGWALAPAGTQVNTERATSGVAVTPDGQGVYAVTSGIFDQAVESVNANTLAAVPTLTSAAFEGVLADSSGHVWTSSGPENAVFEYVAAAPGAPLVDARLAGPAPQEPNRGIPVTGYPGAIVSDPTFSRLFVAGTLSVPQSVVEAADGGVPCPGSDANTIDPQDDGGSPICSVVNVLDDATDPTATPVVHAIAVGRDAYGLAFDPDVGPTATGKTSGTLYVSNWADQTNPGRTGVSSTGSATSRLQSATGTISVVTVNPDGSGVERAVVPVGKAPMGVALSPDHKLLVVANSADDTVSAVPINPTTGNAAGTAHTVDVGLRSLGSPLGAQPVSVAFSPDGSEVFVALAGLDAVEILSATGDDVHEMSQSVGVPGQANPVSSPGTFIPTGWWPADLAIGPEPSVSLGGLGITPPVPSQFRMYVANLKGEGAGPGYYGQVSPVVGTGTEGTISAVDVPAAADSQFNSQMNAWTAQVVQGDRLVPVLDASAAASDPAQHPCQPVALPGGGSTSSAVLCNASAGVGSSAGGSTLTPRTTHVVMILAENKTFDSYFGDTGATLASNADPTFTEYPQTVTTNQHALASQFSLSDDFWNEGAESSVVGHSWWASGVTTPARELTWGLDYDQGLRGGRSAGEYAIGSSPNLQSASLSGARDPAVAFQESLMDNPYATLADEAAAANSGLSALVYGTDVSPVPDSPSRASQVPEGPWGEGPASGGNPTPGTDLAFPDSDRAQIFLHGQTPFSHAWDVLESQTPPPSFGKPFPTTPLASGYTLDGWKAAYAGCRATGGTDATCQGSMPNFVYMTLPENHTFDVSNVFNPLNPTPQSMVADNDYGIGQIVQGLSQSPFWKNTLVLLSEDDNQYTGDHVDVHRTFLLAMGGLAAGHGPAGHVSSQPGSFPSALKTVEVLLGLPPLTFFDWRATPLDDVVAPSYTGTGAAYQAVIPPTPFLEGVQALAGAPPPPP
jgi:DNA-binding beta-propeller fold protein YncE